MGRDLSFATVGSVGLGVVGFMSLVQGTIIGQFLLWFPFGWSWFGWLFNFVWASSVFLGAGFFVLLFLAWTKNVYILSVLFLAFILFIKFGLRAVGG